MRQQARRNCSSRVGGHWHEQPGSSAVLCRAYRRTGAAGQECRGMYWPLAAGRLQQHNPRMKLIAVLRNPIDRANWACCYTVQKGRENIASFEEAIASEQSRLNSGDDFHLRFYVYLARGLSRSQLGRLFQHFPVAQVRILFFEDLKAGPEVVVENCFWFLSVEPRAVDIGKKHNRTLGRRHASWMRPSARNNVAWARRLARLAPARIRHLLKEFLSWISSQQFEMPRMLESTRRDLVRHFEPEIARLEEMTGKNLDAWRK